ncbi:MAG: hypothetical protein Kow00106_16530 [Anaerolineae bacterium]
MREPDWEALADLQFLLYNRIADSLNAALSSIALSDMPEAQNRPPGFWKDRAQTKVANVLNLVIAWSHLIRYKRGDPIPAQAQRTFRANALLTWLSAQLHIAPPPLIEADPVLHGNQETLQEALLMLYSAAQALGTGVRLETEVTRLGTWFHVRFARPPSMPSTLDALLANFREHWRDQSTRFELTIARDFVRMNGAELMLGTSGMQADLMFFVRAAGAPRPAALPPTPSAVQTAPPGKTRPLDPAVVATSPSPAERSTRESNAASSADLPAADAPAAPVIIPVTLPDPKPPERLLSPPDDAPVAETASPLPDSGAPDMLAEDSSTSGVPPDARQGSAGQKAG